MTTEEIQRFYDDVARRIAAARRQHGPSLTQEELASLTPSLSRSAIANIESLRQRVALHQLLEIAAALSTSPSDLLPRPELGLKSAPTMPRDEAARRFLSSVLDSKSPRLHDPENP